MKIQWLLLAAVIGAWSIPAHGQMVKAQDPDSVVRALKSAGYEAEVGADKDGSPTVTSTASGSRFMIFFYNCTGGKSCATVQFFASYEVKPAVTLDKINQWNREQRFGRAYLDKDGDPVVEMDLDLDDGGVSTPLFKDNVEFWVSVLGRFETFIGYRE